MSDNIAKVLALSTGGLIQCESVGPDGALVRTTTYAPAMPSA